MSEENSQHEKPEHVASIAIFKARMQAKMGADGVVVSGARIENFEKGWAIPAFGADRLIRASKAHYYTRNRHGFAIARCASGPNVGEALVMPANGLFGAGNYPRCKSCQRSVDKRP